VDGLWGRQDIELAEEGGQIWVRSQKRGWAGQKRCLVGEDDGADK
jgi:hypothetical protein